MGTATAQEAPAAEPDTRQEAAGKVLAAVRKGDGAALNALAQRDKPDPWLVADDLWASGNDAVALQFAKAAPRKDTEKLSKYVESRIGKRPNDALRTALAKADEAFGRKDPRAALAVLESVTPNSDDLVSVELLEQLGRAFHMLERFEDSATAYRSAAQAAERLGWLARAARIFNDLGDGAYARSNRQGALQAWKLQRKLEQLRGNRAGEAATLSKIGLAYDELGENDNALKFHERALEIREALRDRLGMAVSLGEIGANHFRLGEYEKARKAQKRALDMWVERKNARGEAVTLGSLGLIHLHLGNYKRAIDFGKNALAKHKEIGDPAGEAASNGDLGVIYERLEKYKEALDCQNNAYEIKKTLKNPGNLAKTYGAIGRLHMKLGKYEEALAYLEVARELNQAHGNRAGEANNLGEIGVVHDHQRNYEKALEFLSQALEIRKSSTDVEGQARTYMDIGLVHYHRGTYEDALEFHEKAREISQELGKEELKAKALGNIGNAQWSLGDYEKALESQRRSLELNRKLNDRIGEAKSLGSIGAIHRSLGAHADALESQQQALKLSRELGDSEGVAAALVNIGNIHVSLGGLDRSLEFQKEALALNQKLGNRVGEATTLGNIGNIHAKLGDYEEALKYQQDALTMSRELNDRAGEAAALGNIGSVHAKLKDHEKARKFLEDALALNRKLKSRAYLVANLEVLGDVYESLEKYDKARDKYEEALAESKKIGSPRTPIVATALGILLLDHFDKPADAAKLLKDAIRRIEARRSVDLGLSDEQRASYARTLGRGRSYAAMVRAQLALGHPLEALSYAERGRARAVLDLLARSRLDPLEEAERLAKARGATDRLAEIATVREQLTAAERKIRHLTHALAARRSLKDVERSELEALAKKLRAAKGEREDQLGARARLIREHLQVGAPASPAEVRAGLRPGERMLFYSVGRNGSLLFVVSPGDTEIRSFALQWPDSTPVTQISLVEAVAEHRDWIIKGKDRARGFKKREQKEGKPRGRDLFEALVPPKVRTELVGLKRVYLVPDGVLHRLPFETLSPADDTYWIDSLPPIAYGHSGSVLLWCNKRRKNQGAVAQKYEVVALGDPIYSRSDEGDSQPPEKGALVKKPMDELEAGDVIVAYDGKPIDGIESLTRETHRVISEIIAGKRKKGPIKLKVWRAGEQQEFAVSSRGIDLFEIAPEAPRAAWSALRGESEATLERSERLDRFGPLSPLPGTRRETIAIREAVSKDVRTLLDKEATKSRLFDLAPKSRFLHIATHGLVDETEYRGYSRLALTLPRFATPRDDGFLSMYELFEDWRGRLAACQLVVLSACETVRGPLEKDEGPYALPLGFLYAGSPAVIGSLWQVDDASTADLFANFYKRVEDDKPKLQAFTEARKALREKKPEPYYWAPFVYIGAPR